MPRYEHEEKILDVEGLPISYTDIGPKDGHVVFCVPGLLSTARDFDFLGKELARHGYRCLSITLPGRGKSGRFSTPAQYVPPSYLPYCLALLEHEASGQDFCWLGVSLGGILGMMLHTVLGDNPARMAIELGQRFLDSVPVSMPDIPPSELGKKLPKALEFFVPKNMPISMRKPLSMFAPFYSFVESEPQSQKPEQPTQPEEHRQDRSLFELKLPELPMMSAKMTRLILVDIGAEIPAHGMDLIADVVHSPTVFGSKEAALAVIKRNFSGWCVSDDKIWEHIASSDIIERKDGVYEMHYDPNLCVTYPKQNQDFPMWHLWDGIEQQTLLVRGGKSRILLEKTAREMRERYHGKRFDEIVYEHCGHVPNVMEKTHINALVTWIENT